VKVNIEHVHSDGQADASIGLFAVHPMFQSQGVGRKLFVAAEQFARDDLLCVSVVLHVIRIRDELRKWYLSMGFKSTGEKAPFPVNPDVWTPLVGLDQLEFDVLRKSLVLSSDK